MYNIKNKNNRNRSGTLGLIMGIICIFGIVYAVFIINLAHGYHNAKKQDNIPIVINTWSFTNATKKAWDVAYKEKRSALDAVESGCYTCQEEQCDTTVGYGGSPDENGETTLDAMIMDGSTMNVGAVADLRRIKNAISVARHVLEHTTHSIIVGNQASEFAKMMGFKEEPLETNVSLNMWKKWKENHCQPNFWMKVYPNPMKSCGPYKPELSNDIFKQNYNFNNKNHDTIGIIVIDNNMNIAAGTSTNGAKNKIPGRVGDSPIPGAGAYADNDVGAAAATGDGDVLLRFLPSFLAVEEMRKGKSPSEATKTSMKRISSKYPIFFGGIIALNKNGEYGAACHGMEQFHFTIMNPKLNEVTVKSVECTNIEL